MCLDCTFHKVVKNGHARGLQRYRCVGCSKTFNATTGTSLTELHHKERLFQQGDCLAKGNNDHERLKAWTNRQPRGVATRYFDNDLAWMRMWEWFVDAAQGSSNFTFALTSRTHSVVTDANFEALRECQSRHRTWSARATPVTLPADGVTNTSKG